LLYREQKSDTHYGRNVRPPYHSNKRVSAWEIYDIPGAESLAVKSTPYSDRSNGHRQIEMHLEQRLWPTLQPLRGPTAPVKLSVLCTSWTEGRVGKYEFLRKFWLVQGEYVQGIEYT